MFEGIYGVPLHPFFMSAPFMCPVAWLYIIIVLLYDTPDFIL